MSRAHRHPALLAGAFATRPLRAPRRPARERGMSMFGWIAIVLMVGTLGLIGLRLAPIYIDYFHVLDVAQTIVQEGTHAGKSKAELRDLVALRFRQNNLRNLKPMIFKFSKDAGQRLVITIDYEQRVNVFGNLDVVAVFKKTILPS